ncbi:hypothetical protein HYQ46_011926 [Verticillium longisporum]|nr:hypothetical protein HYQ46_011926 [Verticillium longisporum]
MLNDAVSYRVASEAGGRNGVLVGEESGFRLGDGGCGQNAGPGLMVVPDRYATECARQRQAARQCAQ